MAGALRPEDIGWRPNALGRDGGPDGVRVTWLGTAGFAVEHRGHVVLIDPYVTRASLASCLLSPLRPDADAIAAYVPRADAIVLGHTHFDHALDVPEIAKRTGARVFGSRSAAALCIAHGVPPDRVDVVERESTSAAVERESGPFELRFVPSAHSRLVLGRVPFAGDISDCGDIPMRAEAYRCGAVFGVEVKVGGRTLYHMGSAELVDENIHTAHADLLLMCVAGWTSTREFPERALHRVAAGAVLLAHWDDFLRPLGRPARALPRMMLPRLVERLTCAPAARGVKVGTLPLLGELWV
ncbi:MAG TPA: MBL fold metallo-hydrolase [Polyangiaceae bacterium]|nr:MBL fold metallo-hydrolase [Polyangiaceae bacterium]